MVYLSRWLRLGRRSGMKTGIIAGSWAQMRVRDTMPQAMGKAIALAPRLLLIVGRMWVRDAMIWAQEEARPRGVKKDFLPGNSPHPKCKK